MTTINTWWGVYLGQYQHCATIGELRRPASGVTQKSNPISSKRQPTTYLSINIYFTVIYQQFVAADHYSWFHQMSYSCLNDKVTYLIIQVSDHGVGANGRSILRMSIHSHASRLITTKPNCSTEHSLSGVNIKLKEDLPMLPLPSELLLETNFCRVSDLLLNIPLYKVERRPQYQ